MNSNKSTARVAGLLYLIVIICGVYAEFFVRAKLFIPNDPVATANHIKTSESLYRLGFVSDLIMITAYFFLPIVLFRLLKSVSKYLAGVMVACVLMAVAILSVNMLNHIAPLLLVKADYLQSFTNEQIQGVMLFFTKLHGQGYFIAQIFFGLWLFPLGYLALRSYFFPNAIAIALMLGSVGYLLDFLLFFLLPDIHSSISEFITLPADLGEFSMCLWLLIKGVRE